MQVARKKASEKTLFERLDDTVLGAPIRVVNRTFLAGLGVISNVRDEFETAQTEWDKQFKKLVKDGEKTRDRIEKDWMKFRKDFDKQFTDVKDRVLEPFRPAPAK